MSTVEHQVVTPEGEIRWQEWTDKAVFDEEGCLIGYQAVGRDITERKALEERLEHRVLHDPLTDLPNRPLFADRLEHALARIERREGKVVAVLFVDLDNFKVINDSLGHEAGDQLLVAVSNCLRSCLRAGDTVARWGGDEFAILLEDISSAGAAYAAAQRIAEGLQAPFALEGHQVYATASIGIVFGVSSGDVPKDLLRKANIALHRAKSNGKGQHAVFDPWMDDLYAERLRLESDLRRAIERKEFRVYYQPKVSLENGDIVGMEALVMWEHPERGLIPPARFVPLAEETGLILRLGRWVLKEACHQAKGWHERYPSDSPLIMCVNLSGRQLQHPEVVADVAEALRESGLEPRSLYLEINESILMEDVASNAATLRQLKDLGVKLVVDDFGPVYSSLSYLKRLPVTFLKIDRSFVEGLGKDPEDKETVAAVISLAHTLGLKVVAKGVETKEQLTHVRDIGCDLAQGHYFWQPLFGEAASELLASELCR